MTVTLFRMYAALAVYLAGFVAMVWLFVTGEPVDGLLAMFAALGLAHLVRPSPLAEAEERERVQEEQR